MATAAHLDARTSIDDDTVLWAEEQVALLRARRFDELDLENIIEEIDYLSNSRRRELRSRLTTIAEHLLKLRHSADIDPRHGWAKTVNRERIDVDELLDDSPSLRRTLPGLMAEVYRRARQPLDLSLRPAELAAVPNDPSLTIDELLDDDFFPGGRPTRD